MLGPAMSGIQRDMQGVKNDGNMRNKASSSKRGQSDFSGLHLGFKATLFTSVLSIVTLNVSCKRRDIRWGWKT
jgi:hypothetical protein